MRGSELRLARVEAGLSPAEAAMVLEIDVALLIDLEDNATPLLNAPGFVAGLIDLLRAAAPR